MPRKAKSCPVGLVCFRIKIRHIALLMLLLAVFFIFLIHNKNKNNSEEKTPLKSNFTNMKSTNKNNNKKNQIKNIINEIINPNNNSNNNNSNNNNSNNNNSNNNNSNRRITIEDDNEEDNEKGSETTHITINYQAPPDNRNSMSDSTYLINKDYERVINPLEPPERRNFYLQSSGLERVIAPPGVPINIPTRGYSGGVMQVGILHKEEVTDNNKRIGINSDPVILPLFGRQTYNGSNKWSYYTSTDKMNQIKIPISNKNRVCNSEYGCDELYDGDIVSVPAYNGDFKVSIYEFDKPRYIPYV